MGIGVEDSHEEQLAEGGVDGDLDQRQVLLGEKRIRSFVAAGPHVGQFGSLQPFHHQDVLRAVLLEDFRDHHAHVSPRGFLHGSRRPVQRPELRRVFRLASIVQLLHQPREELLHGVHQVRSDQLPPIRPGDGLRPRRQGAQQGRVVLHHLADPRPPHLHRHRAVSGQLPLVNLRRSDRALLRLALT